MIEIIAHQSTLYYLGGFAYQGARQFVTARIMNSFTADIHSPPLEKAVKQAPFTLFLSGHLGTPIIHPVLHVSIHLYHF